MTITKALAGEIVVKRAGTARTISVVASTASPDRVGDVIDQAGWKLGPYKKNPVVLWGHDYTAPVARSANIRVEGGRLLADVVFPDSGVSSLSDRLWGLIQAGILRTVSVGFKPLAFEPRRDRPGGLRFTSMELLEISLVTVPANSDAAIDVSLLQGRSAGAPYRDAARQEQHLMQVIPALSRRRSEMSALRRSTIPDRAAVMQRRAAAANCPRLAARAGHLAQIPTL